MAFPNWSLGTSELLAGIRVAREQAKRREGILAEDARELVQAWAGQ